MENLKVPNTVSYMMAVPGNKEEIKTPEAVLYRLSKTPYIKVKDVVTNKVNGHFMAITEHNGKEYKIEFYADRLQLSKGYVFMHHMESKAMEAFKGEIFGVTTAMRYDENPAECYHVHLKFLLAIMPNMAGAIDFSTERILSGVWLGMAAMSKVTPAPYHLCAVSMLTLSPESEKVWIHTHGLNRCGLCELEIIDADKDRVKHYGNLITSAISRILVDKKLTAVNEPMELQNSKFSLTWIDWKDAMQYYDEKAPGGKIDREGNHNMFISSLFAYMSEEDAKNKKVTNLNDVPLEDIENAMFTMPVDEQKRISALAKERLGFLRDGVMLNKDARVLVKVLIANGDNSEYVWINLHKIDNAMVYGASESDAVYDKNIKKGTTIQVEIQAIADWILYTKDYPVGPDTSYLIVEQLTAYKQARQNGSTIKEATEANTISSPADITRIDDLIKSMD